MNAALRRWARLAFRRRSSWAFAMRLRRCIQQPSQSALHARDLIIDQRFAIVSHVRHRMRSQTDLQKLHEEANRGIAEDRFWANRGKAIQEYARLEQAMCAVFSDLSGMSGEAAAIIFFRIASAQARNDMLDKLMHVRHGSTYGAFWNSIHKALGPLDRQRNEIVHWLAVRA